MWRTKSLMQVAAVSLSLVMQLAAVSLATRAVADRNTAGMSTAPPPIATTTLRSRDRGRQKTRRRTTTTESYHDDDDDAEFHDHTSPVLVITTTADPRSFDHTEKGTCEVPLGMESGMILNESLTSSSSYDQSVSPLSARIRTEIRGGAWCPNGLISPDTRQYLEIDLQSEYLITATESQGRFANSIGVEFVEFYMVEYWRRGLKGWANYKDFSGNKLIPGNANTYTPKKTILEAPFVASKVRFLPYAAHHRTACMRVEMYGCLFKQALISYSAPKGGTMAAMAGGSRFEDLSYDGVLRNTTMLGGLGQMTDSLTGPNDFELLDPTDSRGSQWVGWNKTTLQSDEVQLTFNFTGARIMHSVDLHTNNMFTKDVQLFKEAEIYFSLEGERWQEDYVSYEPKQDRVAEDARLIHIDLENRTATHIMIKLKFQHEWILLSEVTFKSTPTEINTTLDEYYRTENTPSSKKKKIHGSLKISVGLACGALVGVAVCITGATVYLTRRPAVVDEDYREPYNIWRETLGQREKRNNNIQMEQNEYNEISEETPFPRPRPYMMKRPDHGENFYAATDIIHHRYPEERVFCQEKALPGLFSSVKLPEADPPNGVAPLLDFPRGRMRPVTFLGEGPYGTIQICETEGIEELFDEKPQHRGFRRLVVVKTLWRGCHNDIKTAFAREATWGAGLKHPQLARVLGLSLQEPPCAALDRGNATPLTEILKGDKRLTYGSLIHICCQIASGMKYLESFELVHRDLAARNITVAENLSVKIADYAMFVEEYVGDYHVMGDGLRLPLRWMAWESILLGMYAPASDVWSFGVTVWEILTHCTAKPFDEMTDDQVVENAAAWRKGGRKARVPAAPPPRCRRELYDLMHECWRRVPSQRPRFNDLHSVLLDVLSAIRDYRSLGCLCTLMITHRPMGTRDGLQDACMEDVAYIQRLSEAKCSGIHGLHHLILDVSPYKQQQPFYDTHTKASF